MVPPGLGFGRIGNFINGELWGKFTHSDWGVIFPNAPELAGMPAAELRARFASGALAPFARHPSRIHLLLSDVVMPRMSGTELARRLVPLRPDMRVLYMSGFSETLASEIDAPAGDVAILQKPFTPERLARAVRECLQP